MYRINYPTIRAFLEQILCEHVFSISGKMVTTFKHPQPDIILKRIHETTLLLLLSIQDVGTHFYT